MSKDTRAKHLMGGKGKSKKEKPKKELDHIRVRKSGDGHIVEHHHTRPDHHPMESHDTSGDDELIQHLLEHMGTPNEGEMPPGGDGDGDEGGAPPTQGIPQTPTA